ncbi:MAG TPA: copper amine oxidase N-terminal domain-containing protein [Clostridia bacterium]|jgi:hypothetical protein|nr:copper amine oxidase N-terminal domain-containing protein [Clostridia bacterium]
MWRKGKLFCLVLIPVFITSMLAQVSDREITLMVEGKKLSLHTPPMIVGGRILVPFWDLLESMGVKVDWDEAYRTVIAETDNISVRHQLATPCPR